MIVRLVMSLESFVALKDVKARLDVITPNYSRPLSVSIRVPSRSSHPRLIGTAFDYALRFELSRLRHDATSSEWIAELAVDRLRSLCSGDQDARDAARVVRKARDFVTRYRLRSTVPPRTRLALAGHAIRLAKLDVFHRRGVLEPTFAEADREDVHEILRLIEIVPFEELAAGSPLKLNTSFGWHSKLVGGADADLINGNRLIDFKTTKEANVERNMVRQLIGYMVLAHRARRKDKSLPKLKSLDIYFARFGHTWSMPTAPILSHPAIRVNESETALSKVY